MFAVLYAAYALARQRPHWPMVALLATFTIKIILNSDSMSSTTKKVFALMIVLVLIGLGFYLWPKSSPQPLETNAPTAQTISYSYRIDDRYDGSIFEQNLIRKDANGAEEVLITGLVERYRQPFRILEHITDRNLLVLGTFRPDTENVSEMVYTLNLGTLEINKLKINEIMEGLDFGPKLFSPDKTKLAWVPMPVPDDVRKGIAQKLFVGDIINDTYKLVVELNANENFSSNVVGGLSTNISIEWLDNKTIKYAVYEVVDHYQEAPLIRYREIKVE